MAKAQPRKLAAAKPKTKEEYFDAPPSDQVPQIQSEQPPQSVNVTADQFFGFMERGRQEAVDSIAIEIRPAHSFDGSGLTITYGVQELHFSWDEIALNMRRYAKGSDV